MCLHRISYFWYIWRNTKQLKNGAAFYYLIIITCKRKSQNLSDMKITLSLVFIYKNRLKHPQEIIKFAIPPWLLAIQIFFYYSNMIHCSTHTHKTKRPENSHPFHSNNKKGLSNGGTRYNNNKNRFGKSQQKYCWLEKCNKMKWRG